MKINVSGILRRAGATLKVDEKIKIDSIDYKGDLIPVNSPVDVSAVITNTEGNLLITGKIKADLTLKCSRCLESFNYLFENDFEEELSNNDDSEDAIHFEGETIDITDIVVNNILLYLPISTLCSEDCKGLCPKCGVNLNINPCDCKEENLDPRLAVLKGLLKDD